MAALVSDPGNIRLGMIGLTEGNGHPYSWSAIINGEYDKGKMSRECPYAAIPDYLNAEPPENYDLTVANVTHICCDARKDAEHIAACSLIPNVVDKPADMIGQVDAVIIGTDQPQEHIARVRPFIEADIPIFVDKPLCADLDDLKQFRKWVYEDNKAIMSSSGRRYAKEYLPYQLSTSNLGKLEYVSMTMCKYWETYGIHALESVYPVLGPGFISVQNIGTEARNNVQIKHRDDIDVAIICGPKMKAGALLLNGCRGEVAINSTDTFYAFKAQMKSFIDYLQTGILPFPFSETEELMKLLIAGIISREENNRVVYLEELS